MTNSFVQLLLLRKLSIRFYYMSPKLPASNPILDTQLHFQHWSFSVKQGEKSPAFCQCFDSMCIKITKKQNRKYSYIKLSTFTAMQQILQDFYHPKLLHCLRRKKLRTKTVTRRKCPRL